jgi:hypothetical protein
VSLFGPLQRRLLLKEIRVGRCAESLAFSLELLQASRILHHALLKLLRECSRPFHFIEALLGFDSLTLANKGIVLPDLLICVLFGLDRLPSSRFEVPLDRLNVGRVLADPASKLFRGPNRSWIRCCFRHFLTPLHEIFGSSIFTLRRGETLQGHQR